MKIQTLGPLTGACGEREKGETFEVEEGYGKGLIARGWAVEITDAPASKPGKSVKADSGKE